MYPKNAASPPRIYVGPVIQVSDGAVQTSGVAVTVTPEGGSENSGGGTIAYSTKGGVWYTPTQAETNYSAFLVEASKTGCIPQGRTVVTTATATAGTTVVTTNNDKTGYSLLATGADLILKSSTFIQAIVAAINEFATYGLTALNTLLVSTGIKAASVPNVTLANGAHGGAAATLALGGSAGLTANALGIAGAMTVGDGIAVTCSTAGRPAIAATGNTSGGGIVATGGNVGPGILATGGGNNAAAHGLSAVAGGALAEGLKSAETDAILPKLLKYVQLLVRKDSGIKTDNAVELTAINANGGSGAGAFDSATDSEEALADTETTINTNVLAISTALTPVSQAAGSSTDTTGTVISGTYANTDTADASLWVTAPAGGGLDMRLNFALGANRLPVSVAIVGWFNAATARYVDVYAYDYKNAAWNQLSNSSNRMAHRTTSTTYSYPLTMQNVDPATGNAIIRFASASTTAGDRLSLDRVVVNSVGGSAGAPAGITPEQVWNYVTRTLTSDIGEPIDTAALVTAIAAAILLTPANKISVNASNETKVAASFTVTGDVTLAASQPNYDVIAALQTLIGTPADTDVSTDIANIAAALITAAAIADKIIGRNIAGGSDGGRTVGSALQAIRNKVDLTSIPGKMIVYAEDDATESWRADLTTDPAAQPIVKIDPTT